MVYIKGGFSRNSRLPSYNFGNLFCVSQDEFINRVLISRRFFHTFLRFSLPEDELIFVKKQPAAWKKNKVFGEWAQKGGEQTWKS